MDTSYKLAPAWGRFLDSLTVWVLAKGAFEKRQHGLCIKAQ